MARSDRARKPRRPPPTTRVPALSSAAIGALFLATYLVWTPLVSGDKDASEFTAVLGTLGLAHPTGYPIYTLFGHGFVAALHALGAPWAWAANAWSALGGALAIGLWHAFAARLLAREGVPPMRAVAIALLPCAAFGLNSAWTSETTLAEVNSWHVAWVAGACLFALTTFDRLPALRTQGHMMRRCAEWGALVGLGISHHATSVWFALPLTIALIAAARPVRPSWLVAGAVAALLPLTSWSYVLYRSTHPAAVQWTSLGPGLHETWNHVTAAGYRHYLGGFSPTADERSSLATNVYPWLVPGVIALAFWSFAPRQAPRGLRRALAAAAVLQLGYGFSYGVSDPVAYFLPALALGLFVLPAVARTRIVGGRAAWALASIAAVVVAIASTFWIRAALQRRTMYEELDAYLHTMWMSVPIQRGYVIWNDDMSYRLIQYQQLNHERRELVVVAPRPLMDQGARRLFARRHGFDPLAGGSPPPEAEADSPARVREFADLVGDGINRSTADSVILFQPKEGTMRLLPKTSAPRAR